MRTRISLRWLLPLAILAIALTSALVATFQDYFQAHRDSLDLLRQRAASTCHLMTPEFERALQEKNIALIHQQVQTAMLIPDLLQASLLDPDNRLVSCSDGVHGERQVEMLKESKIATALDSVRTKQTVTSIYDPIREVIVGIAPIRFADLERTEIARSTGAFMVQLDFKAAMESNRNKLWRHVLTFVLMIGIATTIISYLFSRMLNKDLGLLMEMVDAYRAGRSLPRMAPTWCSELVGIGGALKSMFNDLNLREQEIKSSDLRFRELFDSSADGAMLIDRRGLILAANRTICEMIGVSETELVAHGTVGLTLTTNSKLVDYATELERCGTVTFEAEFVRRDRTTFWAEVKAQRLKSANLDHYLAAIRDITQRIEMAAKEREELIDQKLLTQMTGTGIESHNLKQFQASLLGMLGTRLKISRAYIFSYNYEANTMDNTAEWVENEILPLIDEHQVIPCSALPWWTDRIMRGETIEYHDIENVPDEPTKKLLRIQRTKSILVMPLYLGNRNRGFIGLDHCTEHHAWNEREKNLLSAVVRVLMGVWADDELRQSDERIRSMLMNLESISVLSFSGDGSILYWNHAAEHFYGYEANEALGRNVNELIVAPEQLSQQEILVKQLLESMVIPTPQEQTLRRKDGRCITVKSYWTIVKLPGQTTEYFRFDTDLTEIRRIQEKERQLGVAVAQSPVGVLVTDVKGNITYVNRAFEASTGYQEEEVLGKNPRFLQSGKTPTDAYRELWTSLRLGRDWRGQFLNRRKNGELYWELNHISPVLDSDGKVHNFLAIKEDISERIRAEEEREKLQAQLMQAQKMETVGRFAGGIAHDFNNMLNVILGYTEISLDLLEEGSSVRELLAEVRAAANRSASLTRQLLAFSRKQTLQSEIIDINSLLVNTEVMIRRIIGEDIEISLLLSEQVDNIEADRSQIEQVVMNLVVNACDAMPNGGQLTIETAHYKVDADLVGSQYLIRPGSYVRLSISDSGVGMDAQTLQHIFDPFFTTKEVGKGTGLGLATVYAIVNSIAGQIHVYSEPGLGSTFHVYLPSTSTAVSAELVEEIRPHRCGGETILVVEDEVSLQQLLVHILSQAGYKVIATSEPKKAIEILVEESSDIALLLTDVIMPVMNGAELSKRLCEMKPDLKVLFMSGYTDAIISQHGVQTSVQKFINKPFTAAGILNSIEQVLADID
jgi:two-component system cell cycle sensor histidine kinase/response regulator CckA